MRASKWCALLLALLPWSVRADLVQGIDATATKRTLRTDTSGNLTSTGASASTSAAFGAVQVLTAAGGTTIPGTSGRRAVIIQNLGPNIIWCGVTLAGTAPLATDSLKLATNGERVYEIAVGLVLKCIAETANQATPLDTRYQEIG